MNTIQSPFQNAKAKLNAAQLQAVETIEGPVMVLAGPGTGKTEVLATRIGQILTETDMQASNILCLTFSNAGVESMEKRLQKLLGKTGEEIEVHTYHSFAQKIINENNQTAIQKSQLITETQRFMILEKLFSNSEIAGKYFELKPANASRLNSMAKLFGLFKKEGITIQALRDASVYALQQLLPFNEDYLKKNGELNADGRKIEIQIQEFTEAVAPMYEAYLKIIKEKNKLEYDDLLDKAIEILSEDENMLFNYREKYQYILVDEFQDTNKKQLDLLEVLIREVEQPNLFIVGDDDQCVYKFQGANAENFNWICEILPDMQVILLDKNYRSTQAILDSSHQVISNNNNRHELKNAALEAGIDFEDNNHPIVKSFADEDQEAFGIVSEIKRLIDDGHEDSTITVLYRKNKEAAVIKKWLNHFDISFSVNQTKGNLLKTDFGKRVYSIFQFIRLYQKDNNNAIVYFHKLMMELGYSESLLYTSLFHKQHVDKAQNYFDWLNTLQADGLNKNTVEVFRHLIQLHNQSDQKLSASFLEAIMELATIQLDISETLDLSWEDFVKEFSATTNSDTPISLANLLFYHHIYDLSIDYKLSDKVSSGVILSTIHSSKGLEYDFVFIKGCQNKNWEDSGDSRGGITVPRVLNQIIKQDSDDLEDLRRVFYVGMTRAKCKLYISFCKDETLKYPSFASQLLAPFFEMETIQPEDMSLVELPSLEDNLVTIETAAPLMELIQNKIAQFAISTSSTYNWLQCQNKFFFANICKIQDEGNEAMSFGSMVHEVLEEIAKDISMQRDVAKIQSLFDRVFVSYKYQFHPLHEFGYRQAAKSVVINYLNEKPFLNTPDEVEKYLSLTLPNGVKLSGVLDRLEFHGDTAKVIDYKSGKYYANNEIFSSSLEPGSGYWRQGMMYNYLIRGVYGNEFKVDFAFHYVEEKEEKNRVKPFTYEANLGYEEWLLKIWNQIQERKFNKSCADEGCVYCRERVTGN
jgi:DNA helicase-2/ATP-dependent DNA helicase PcrA